MFTQDKISYKYLYSKIGNQYQLLPPGVDKEQERYGHTLNYLANTEHKYILETAFTIQSYMCRIYRVLFFYL